MMFIRFAAVAATAAISLAVATVGHGPVRDYHGTSSGHRVSALCSKSFDPYKAKTAVVRSCGNEVVPRGSVTSLPGGGKAYTYPGAGLTFPVPPAHFDPLKASDRRLSEYGYPTRHQLGASWYGVVRHMRHPVVPPPYLVVLRHVHVPAPRPGPAPLLAQGRPCEGMDQSECWGGYDVTGHTYTSVDSKWWEPTFGSTSCQTTAFGQWVGLGGINHNKLGQDGTLSGGADAGAHQAFIGKVSANDPGNSVPLNLFATPGQQFFAEVTWDPGNSRYDFVLVNEHTGDSLTPHSSQVDGYDGSTAEVITENPFVDGQWTYLSNFGQFLVDNDEAAYGNGSPVPLNQLTSEKNQILNVFTGDTLMAGPGDFISNGSNFNMFFNACK
jgi:hypothetical protein